MQCSGLGIGIRAFMLGARVLLCSGSLALRRGTFSDGKVQFSSVQRGISLNLELNSRFGSGHFAEP